MNLSIYFTLSICLLFHLRKSCKSKKIRNAVLYVFNTFSTFYLCKKVLLFSLLMYNNDTWLLVISWLALMLDAMLAVVFVTQAVGVDTQVAAVLGMQSLLTVTLVARRLFIMELDVVPLRLSSFATTWTV